MFTISCAHGAWREPYTAIPYLYTEANALRVIANHADSFAGCVATATEREEVQR